MAHTKIVLKKYFLGEPQSTWPQYYDSNPVYEQGFVFTVGNPHVDDLHIQIIDQGHKNANIGTTTIRTSDIMASPDMEYVCQPFHLRGKLIKVKFRSISNSISA